MSDTQAATPTYRIWQSPDGVLITGEGRSLEMSVADALALAAEINQRFAPAQPRARKETPELIAECARLYVEEGLGENRIAKRTGMPRGSISRYLKKAGVVKRPGKNTTNLVAWWSRNRSAA